MFKFNRVNEFESLYASIYLNNYTGYVALDVNIMYGHSTCQLL